MCGGGKVEGVEKRYVGVDLQVVLSPGDGHIERVQLLLGQFPTAGEEQVDGVEFAPFGFVDSGNGDGGGVGGEKVLDV